MRNVLIFSLLILCIVGIKYAPLIHYGIVQGIGQLKIVWGARPVLEVLQDPDFPDSLKRKLRVVEYVRAFATDSLYLNKTDNYTTIFDQKGRELMWVVTACMPFQFKPKTWEFPIVGEVPYKGFFDEQKAREEAKKLTQEGWETGTRNPGGWSTLGWFTDPILSGMLMRSEGDLANLIIHEMVHATIFVKDSVDFNENLASFIADSATYCFLVSKYGINSKAYQTYRHQQTDRQRYINHIMRGKDLLDSLYGTLSKEEPFISKQKKKKDLIYNIVLFMDTLSVYDSTRAIRLQKNMPNNDYFMAYTRYRSEQRYFSKVLRNRYKGSLRTMIQDYAHRLPSL